MVLLCFNPSSASKTLKFFIFGFFKRSWFQNHDSYELVHNGLEHIPPN